MAAGLGERWCEHRHRGRCRLSGTATGHWRVAAWPKDEPELLTWPDSQPKTLRSVKEAGIYTGGLMLAPADASGREVCHSRTAGCTAACLGTSTSRVRNMPGVMEARIRKTNDFFDHRELFMDELVNEAGHVLSRAKSRGLKPAMRLNVVSDIAWEAIPVTRNGQSFRNIMFAFPEIQFYDYTKHATRVFRSLGQAPGSQNWPPNYHLTYSRSEAPHSEATAIRVLEAGGSVAVVFRTDADLHRAMRDGWHGFPVIDATVHDARYLDPQQAQANHDPHYRPGKGVVGGLHALGDQVLLDSSGFFVDVPTTEGEGEACGVELAPVGGVPSGQERVRFRLFGRSERSRYANR